MSLKIYRLLHLGYSQAKLRQALNLLADCPWSTLTVEQQHATASKIRKVHPQYGAETLRLRALLCTARHLLPRPMDEEKQVTVALAKAHRLSRRNVNKISGRHIYVRELSNLAKEQPSIVRKAKAQ
eukprot:7577169-Lingulodinium_polyedra.AAC.1